MALDIEKCRVDLEALQHELEQLTAPSQQGFELWRHKMNAVISEVAGSNSSAAIKFNGLVWETSHARRGLNSFGAGGAVPRATDPRFLQAKQASREVIESLRWDLDRRAPATHPFSAATIDPELWEHVRGLVESGDWEKVAREAAVFVESKLREWAAVPTNVSGGVNVFKAAIGGSGGFTLPKTGQASEQQGWQQLATGFALALRNRSGHRVEVRGDAERYALGVLGVASLLLTEVRHDYGDPPKP